MSDKGAGSHTGSHDRVVMTLDGTVHDPGAPLLYADDSAVLRGDGVFETLLVRDGRARLVDEHLERLGRSAQLLALPRPDLPAWRKTVQAAAERWETGRDGVLRLVYTRGREGAAAPTAFVLISAAPAHGARMREEGAAVITLDRGRSVDLADAAPWELAGAKTLSYATNMAAVRYAEKQGADDVVFVSAEGYVLEGPRSTVVIARGGELLTPPARHGILPGTTLRALFGAARGAGITCSEAPLRAADLIAADGVWLLSSVMLVAAVHTINGVAIGRSDLDGRIRALIGGGGPEAGRKEADDGREHAGKAGSGAEKTGTGKK